MSWRTIVISNRCKLDLKLGYMVIRGETTNRVFLDEIAVLIIENPAISLTGCLLEALTDKKIKVIFCDSKRNPQSELVPYYGSHDSSRKIRTQIQWTDEIKSVVWAEIVAEKIRKQAEFLEELGHLREADMLMEYARNVQLGDKTNREGHAAKVYFNALFGMDFTRTAANAVNACLNYGYGIILSVFNREIAANGYLTQLGIFHDNVFNHFNLGSDLMEPFRVIIDRAVYELDAEALTREEKLYILNTINDTVKINSSNQTVLNAIKIYTKSVFDALNEGDISEIKFYTFEGNGK